MKATETHLLKFMQGTRQYVIPIYQRTYSWTLKQCEQLWKDIMRLVKDETLPAHFVGSIVYIEKGLYQVTAVPQLLVIDGQQRLTTISLLLVALARAVERERLESDMSKRKIENYYLLNSEETGEQRYKLLLTQSDRDTLIRIIGGQPMVDGASKRLLENLEYFEDWIRESGVDLNKLFEAINKLIIVDVSLDRNYDNPQLIFESLNSTGLDLSQADLIRNYVLMSLEPVDQTRIYSTYWFPMEQSFGHSEYTELFDRFMRDYLTISTGKLPNIEEVYDDFKLYDQQFSEEARKKKADITRAEIVENLAKEIFRYSKHFRTLEFNDTSGKEIRLVIEDINTLKVDVAYPFLMKVLDDMQEGLVSEDEVLEILKTVVSYIIRRSICGVPTNWLNKGFAGLLKEIDKDAYLESFKAALQIKEGYRRFPTDEEFKGEILVKDVYNFRNRNFLLNKLENLDRKEPVDIEDFTIEHIMPQNEDPPNEWRRELGDDWRDIQARYLHTVGNLTLTGYNPELSDRPFIEKRDMKGGFKDSPIRLNHYLATLQHWNETEIRKRAEMLADLAISIWKAPNLSKEVLQKYVPKEAGEVEKTWTLADHEEYLKGDNLTLFQHLRKRILNLDSSVQEVITKLYIAYKIPSNFVEIQPQKNRLILWLDIRPEELIDPKGLCESAAEKSHWGTGDAKFVLSSMERLDYAIDLIHQALDGQREEANA